MYWEDYELNQTFTSAGRTLTDSDIRMFIGATNATHSAHLDAEYAKTHPFGRIAIQGTLLIGIVDGFVTAAVVSTMRKVMHYGYDRIRFLKPVFVGDTVHLETSVAARRERDDGFGLLELHHRVLNQDGELVCVMTDLTLIERREA